MADVDWKRERRSMMTASVICAVVSGAIMLWLILNPRAGLPSWYLAVFACLFGVSLTNIALSYVATHRGEQVTGLRALLDAVREREQEAAAAIGATDDEAVRWTSLWTVTQERMDAYHEIATGQARQSFRNSVWAMGIGGVFVLVFGALALQASSVAGAVSAGAVSVASGAASAYIGATFIRAQFEAMRQLRQFFNQPVEFTRILAAERLIDSLEPEDRARAVHLLLERMALTAAPSEAGSDKK
ncbi:TRADD-N-associated membrane domain-containing protein [Sinomonas soli]